MPHESRAAGRIVTIWLRIGLNILVEVTEVDAPDTKGVWPKVVWAVVGLALATIAVTIWSGYRAGLATSVTSVIEVVSYMGSLTIFAVSGALIVSRQPRNVVGWLLLVPGLAIPVFDLVGSWLEMLTPVPTKVTPIVWLASWVDSWSWVVLIFAIFHLLLVFPNGKLLSPRWRWAVWVEAAMIGFMLFAAAFGDQIAPFMDDETPPPWSIDNPVGFIPEAIFNGPVFPILWTLGLVGLVVTGLVAFVTRFRTGSVLERQQLKWPMYAIAFFGVTYAAAAIISGYGSASLLGVLFTLSLGLIPASVAVAVLRYRLYDLDRIVSRTVTYLVVALLLLGAYGLVVLTLGTILGRDNPVAVAGATLAAVALFSPVRNRTRGWVDRRFNRARYDAELVIEDFTGALRQIVDPDKVVEGWIGVVSRTMHPAAVGVWIRP